jgi:SDR family mycofactocin-dependent oxidoreductase
MEGRFKGKVALVTGAARGMGQSHALGFAREGANIVVNDIAKKMEHIPFSTGTGEQLEKTIAEIRSLGVRAIAAQGDVSKSQDVQAIVDKAIGEFGRIDILVNNAGTITIKPVADMTEAEWDKVVDVNLKGTFLCSKFVIPHMIRQKWGRIINIASTEGLAGTPYIAHYVASKHGVVGFTKALAQELGKHWITVNAICPGDVGTQLFFEASKGMPGFVEEIQTLQGAYSVFPGYSEFEKPLINPSDITNAVLWLASEEARYVTGVALPVDGGYMTK